MVKKLYDTRLKKSDEDNSLSNDGLDMILDGDIVGLYIYMCKNKNIHVLFTNMKLTCRYNRML